MKLLQVMKLLLEHSVILCIFLLSLLSTRPLWAAPVVELAGHSAQEAQGDVERPPVVELGTRPLELVRDLADGDLKSRLQACTRGPFKRTAFSIAHRGAPLAFPEHTRQSYLAAARQGAGIIECDVTFTKDRVLVCRHSQCDLHTTTNILGDAELAGKCSEPFQPARFDINTGERLSRATAKCCTSDITLAEFMRLQGKVDSAFPDATSAREYMYRLPGEHGLSYSAGSLMTHAQSITLFKALGVQMIPELKAPQVAMPDDFTQRDFASKMLQEYKDANVPPAQVWPQSFSLADVRFWIARWPAFARQGIYLDGRYSVDGFSPHDASTWEPDMAALAAMGVRIIAPPLWMLLAVEEGEMVPSAYARAARSAGLDIVTWSLERSSAGVKGGGWYYQSVAALMNSDADILRALHVLASDVGVRGVFSDWPATTTYYANCMKLK